MSRQKQSALTYWYTHLLAQLIALPQPIKRWVVAFSGGLDSHVLLHLLNESSTLPIDVVHVNHQLQDDARQWEQHCKAVSRTLKCHCYIERVDVDTREGQSVEAAARLARYHALAKYIDEKTALLTAHHADDQAETLLLQLCRGGGVDGLSAMPVVSPFAKGYHLRPLLRYERNTLQAYAKKHSLVWITDPSNEQLRFDRNFIRHQILTPLRSRWPSISQTLSRSSQHCSESSALNAFLAEQDQQSIQQQSQLADNMLPLKALLCMPVVRQRNVIRAWLKKLGFPIPTTAQLDCIMHDVCLARIDAVPVFYFSNNLFQLRRYQNVLYALTSSPVALDPNWQVNWDLKKSLSLPQAQGYLSAKKTTSTHVHCFLPQDAILTIKPYQGSVRFHPIDSTHTCLLKKCVQQWQIPPWVRKQLLLCYWQDQLLLVIRTDTAQYYISKQAINQCNGAQAYVFSYALTR